MIAAGTIFPGMVVMPLPDLSWGLICELRRPFLFLQELVKSQTASAHRGRSVIQEQSSLLGLGVVLLLVKLSVEMGLKRAVLEDLEILQAW